MTTIIIIAITLLVGTYGLIMELWCKPEAGLDEVIIDIMQKNPFVVLCAGIVLGHLFWHS